MMHAVRVMITFDDVTMLFLTHFEQYQTRWVDLCRNAARKMLLR